MIKVCDKWSLDELAIMDDEMREKVLLGWEEEKAPGYNDVRPGSSSFSGAISSSLRSVAGCLTSPVLLSGISGIAVGAALTAAIAHRTLQSEFRALFYIPGSVLTDYRIRPKRVRETP